jgi:hypothetical protein
MGGAREGVVERGRLVMGWGLLVGKNSSRRDAESAEKRVEGGDSEGAGLTYDRIIGSNGGSVGSRCDDISAGGRRSRIGGIKVGPGSAPRRGGRLPVVFRTRAITFSDWQGVKRLCAFLALSSFLELQASPSCR